MKLSPSEYSLLCLRSPDVDALDQENEVPLNEEKATEHQMSIWFSTNPPVF